MRNKSVLLIIVAFAAIGLLVFATSARAQTDTPTTNQEPRTLSVNGNGTISIEPDIARIQIGVHTEGSNAQEAVASNNELVLPQRISRHRISASHLAKNSIRMGNRLVQPHMWWITL